MRRRESRPLTAGRWPGMASGTRGGATAATRQQERLQAPWSTRAELPRFLRRALFVPSGPIRLEELHQLPAINGSNR